MGWLIALSVILVLGMTPLGLGFTYRENRLELLARIWYIPIPIDLNRMFSKEKKPEKKQEKPRPEDQPVNPAAPKPKGKKMDISQILEFVKLGCSLLADLGRKLRVDRMEVNLILAGDDPCDLAVSYGKTWAAAASLQTQLEKVLVIRHRDINIQCDFMADKTRMDGRLDLHLTVFAVLDLACVYGFRALRLLLNQKKRKGGA